MSFAALDDVGQSFVVTSEKSNAINGAILPNSTVSQPYSLSSKPDWVNIAGSEVTVTENRGAERSGEIVFLQSESNLTAKIAVHQTAGVMTNDYVFTFGDGSMNKSWANISASGASNSYTIISTKQVYINGTLDHTEYPGYSSSANVNWASASGSSISVSENNSTTPRGGVMTFRQNESGKTIQVTLLQMKKSSVDIN